VTKKKKIIPKFKSIQEEAGFWDTHDVTDYFHEMKDVKVEFDLKGGKEETVTIRLQPKLKARLKSIAEGYGLQLSTLARMWLIERLRKERGESAPA